MTSTDEEIDALLRAPSGTFLIAMARPNGAGEILFTQANIAHPGWLRAIYREGWTTPCFTRIQ